MVNVDDLAGRTARAVAAAADAGRELGLTVEAPRALYDVFSVVVHLAPAPVVVRVPTVLPRTLAEDRAGQRAQQRHELAVAGWLAGTGHPVVAPSPLVPAEPVRRDGWSMTFWQFVHQVPDAEPTGTERAEVAARLHAALRDYPGELPFMMPMDGYVPDCLDQLAGSPDLIDPADLDRARREWDAIAPLVDSPAGLAAAFPEATVQPLHGDAPFANLIVTPDGVLCGDFEHATLGPVEWDLTFAESDVVDAYDVAAAGHGLRPLDRRLLDVMQAARTLQVLACLTLVDELPLLRDGLRPVVDHWRTTPFAGGL